jgi:hypothetical protein
MNTVNVVSKLSLIFRGLLTSWWGVLFLIAIIWGTAYAYNKNFSSGRSSSIIPNKTVKADVVSHSEQIRLVERNIEDIKIGDRTSGRNPESVSNSQTMLDVKEMETDWRFLRLQMTKIDGSVADIELLRPVWWIETREAIAGNTIYLDLAELGAEGEAQVLSVEPSPKIQRGPGNVVTGTFRHQTSNLIDLYVEGLNKPIGCTANHPFWSVDRNTFVNATNLYSGEKVALHNNKTAKVIKFVPRQGIYTVYNLEVYGEHVYEVTSSGILVHNTCAGYHHLWPKAWGNLIPYGNKALVHLTEAEHTLVHKELTEYLIATTGKAFNSMKGTDWIDKYKLKGLSNLLDDFYRVFSTTAEGQAMAQRLNKVKNAPMNKTMYDYYLDEIEYGLNYFKKNGHPYIEVF